jgi:hypothetical protein
MNFLTLLRKNMLLMRKKEKARNWDQVTLELMKKPANMK